MLSRVISSLRSTRSISKTFIRNNIIKANSIFKRFSSMGQANNKMFVKQGLEGLLPPADCIQGRDDQSAVPQYTKPNAIHFVKKTPLHLSLEKAREMNLDVCMIGMGCFWCSENLFVNMEGVYSTQVGYAMGHTKNPTYQEVCTGRTNHNEVTRIVFDPKEVTYRDLLKVYWTRHDPTTHFQQGGDRGSQYRSGIYYYSEEQKKVAEETRDIYQQDIANSGKAAHAEKKISTEIIPADEKNFYLAEDYHQQYDAKGSGQYCGLRPLPVKSSL